VKRPPALPQCEKVAIDAASPADIVAMRLLHCLALALALTSSASVSSAGDPPALERALASSSGWTTVGFEMGAPGRSCFVKVSGRAEFDRAEIVFADGDLRAVDLHGARRGTGLYELARWDDGREVLGVRMRARARTGTARIRVLLGS